MTTEPTVKMLQEQARGAIVRSLDEYREPEDIDWMNERLTPLGIRPISDDEDVTDKNYEFELDVLVRIRLDDFDADGLAESMSEVAGIMDTSHRNNELEYGTIVGVSPEYSDVKVRERRGYMDEDLPFRPVGEVLAQASTEENDADGPQFTVDEFKQKLHELGKDMVVQFGLCLIGVNRELRNLGVKELPEKKMFKVRIPVSGTVVRYVNAFTEDEAVREAHENIGDSGLSQNGDPTIV